MTDLADKADPNVRTVVVQSPSLMRESSRVALAVFHIVFWSFAIISTTVGAGRKNGTTTRPNVMIDEVAFSALDSDDQRIYRQSLEGLSEAEDVRSRTNDWPSVAQLATRKIPPFAADPLDRAHYMWRLMRDGTLVNYVGTPDLASKRPTIAIVVLEPEPGAAPDPQAITDETHHKLKDGTMLHVSIWRGSRTLPAPVSTPAFEDGWRRITRATP